ncbi:MAG: putative ATP-dependent endonuclease of the family [Chthoniobacter sp.]|nr:putative ATP-dependent endonuclease of the family [Chthoniobacter sp.]
MALADGKSVADLKIIFAELRKQTPDLPAAATKPAMTDTLRTYEQAHPEKLTLIESDDEFYGASKGSHKLSPFIQWVFVPAVKDASSEQEGSKNTALGLLVERAVRSKVQFADKIKELREKTSGEYDAILSANQSALNDLSASLKNRLGKWSHPEVDLSVRWDRDPDKSVRVEEPFAKIFAGECGFIGEIARLGHGLQRSYILAILEELATSDEENAPRLLLGLEEPELFQHPPQAQHLAEVLQRLGDGNAQVTVCTHSPYFVVGKGFEDVRLIRKPRGSSAAKASRTTFVDLSKYLVSTLGETRFGQPVGVRAKLHQVLQPALREMFFAPTLVFVEGLEDVAYITSALVLQDLWEKWRQCGAHLVPVHGKSEFVQPLAIAQLLKIPAFVVFDADGDNQKHQAMHQKDNERLVKLLGQPGHPLFPPTASWQSNFVVWPSNLGDVVRSDYTEAEWSKWKTETEAELGQPGGLEKNAICIATILTKAWTAGKPSPTLDKLCQALLTFAQTATT